MSDRPVALHYRPTTLHFIAGEDLNIGDFVSPGDDGKVYRSSDHYSFAILQDVKRGEIFEHSFEIEYSSDCATHWDLYEEAE